MLISGIDISHRKASTGKPPRFDQNSFFRLDGAKLPDFRVRCWPGLLVRRVANELPLAITTARLTAPEDKHYLKRPDAVGRDAEFVAEKLSFC